MKNSIALSFGILFLLSCQETHKRSSTPIEIQRVESQSKRLNNQQIPETLLTLNGDSKADETSIKENLFGKFFCDRAEFYIIENPQNEIYSTKMESITLYYLDGELKKTRYLLESDIATSLLKDFGKFKISGFDPKNIEIIKSKNIIINTEKGVALNDSLTNYELKWILGEKEIKYRVNTNSKYNKFTYLEEVKDYKKELKAIEKFCI